MNITHRAVHNAGGRRLARMSAAAAVASLVGVAQAEMPPPVRIESADSGQGFLMTRLGSCYAVTAAHVLRTSRLAKLWGPGERELLGHGERVAVDADADLVLLRVSGALAGRCGLDHVVGAPASRLRSEAAALVVYANGDGSVGRDQLDIVDVAPDLLHVRPAKSNAGIAQGLSGSLVEVAGSPAGMLLSVNNQDGVGTVRQYHDLLPRVRRLLDGLVGEPLATPRARTDSAEMASNLAGSAAGAKLMSWSAPPTSAEHHAGRLLAPGEVEFWEVPLVRGQAEVEVELAGERVQTISNVEVSRAGLPAATTPAGLELLVSADRSAWSSAAVFDFSVTADTARADFAPRRARYVRLRVYGANGTESGTVALSRLSIR